MMKKDCAIVAFVPQLASLLWDHTPAKGIVVI